MMSDDPNSTHDLQGVAFAHTHGATTIPDVATPREDGT